MANKPLQSIKFPNLPDTYTVPQIDDTLSESGQAADAKVVGDAVNESNSAIYKITGQEMVMGWNKGKYIALAVSNGTVIDINVPATSANFKYATHACSAGDGFIITGTGGSASRLYGFLDSSNKLIAKAVANETKTNHLLIAPDNAVLLILNVGVNESIPSLYLGPFSNTLYNEVGTTKAGITLTTADIKNAVIGWKNKETESADYVCTDYVRVSGDANKVSLYCTIFRQIAALLFYDIEHRLITYIDGTNADEYGLINSTVPQNVSIALPKGTVYIRANMRSTYYTSPSDFSVEFTNTRSIRETERDNAYLISSNKIEHNDNKLNVLRSKFDNAFNWIAYSNIRDSGQSINTLEHFEWCAKKTVFRSLKADMQLTSDGKIVLCHDNGFTLNENGKVTTFDADNCTLIHDMTYAQCIALQHAGTDQHVCGIDAVLKTCKKYGKHLYITLRDEYYQDTFDALLPKLRQYNLESETIINCYPRNDDKSAYVRSKSKDICIGYTCSANVSQFSTSVDMCIALGNCIVTPFAFNGGIVDIVDMLSAIQPNIDRAKENGLRVYAAIMYQDNATDALMDCGVSGAQTYILPTDINYD